MYCKWSRENTMFMFVFEKVNLAASCSNWKGNETKLFDNYLLHVNVP